MIVVDVVVSTTTDRKINCLSRLDQEINTSSLCRITRDNCLYLDDSNMLMRWLMLEAARRREVTSWTLPTTLLLHWETLNQLLDLTGRHDSKKNSDSPYSQYSRQHDSISQNLSDNSKQLLHKYCLVLAFGSVIRNLGSIPDFLYKNHHKMASSCVVPIHSFSETYCTMILASSSNLPMYLVFLHEFLFTCVRSASGFV